MSESSGTVDHKSLHEAIHGVQAEAATLQKSELNPHFKNKYVPLDKLHEAVLPLLTKHGLTWTTRPGFTIVDDKQIVPTLVYTLHHVASDKAITGEMLLLLSKQDPQGQGSGITYARRYSLMAVLGLVADEDDDGNAGSGRGKSPARKTQSKPASTTPGAVGEAKLNELRTAAKAAGLKAAGLRPFLTEAGLSEDKGPADLTDDQATWVILKVRDLAKGQTAEAPAAPAE